MLKMELTVKNLLSEKTPGQVGFTGEFYKTFKKEVLPTLQVLFQKIGKRG